MVLTIVVEAFRDLAVELDAALENGQLAAVFQPQIDLATGRIVAAEGLCRWQHPVFGAVPPDRFIRVAETSGAIHEIGRFMIGQCLEAADRWGEAASRIEISVNVSPLQLTDEFTEEVRKRWDARGLPKDSLTLEITETLPVLDLDASVPRLAALRAAGIGISLDDYGTGHASLEQLEILPITEVKLDRSLMQDVVTGDKREVARFVALAHERALRVVAEGIESDDQLSFARCVGCDRAQGYLLGTPMGAERIEELLLAA